MQFELEASEQPDLSIEVNLPALGRIRHAVATAAVESGLSDTRADEMALAVNEVACNAIVHGEPPATVKVWQGDGELLCEVSDSGEGIRDPDVGRHTPEPDALGGRGLWLSRLASDAVEIGRQGGSTVSLRAAVPS
jgi:serine/threonine-protein kinase RsbW